MVCVIHWLQDQTSAVGLDTRPDPVVISSWHGRPTVGLVDQYYRWSDRSSAAALAAEQRLIRIADLRAARAPAAEACKRLYEHARDDLAGEVVIVTFVVLDSPLLYDIVKAMGWLRAGREPELVLVERMATALELTLARLRAERIPAPAGLDPVRYGPPPRPRSLRTRPPN